MRKMGGVYLGVGLSDRDMPLLLNIVELETSVPLCLSSRDMPCSLNFVLSGKCTVLKAIMAHKLSSGD